jgi:hypothetical protein
MSAVKQISERVSYKKHGDYVTFVISPRLDEKKQMLLTFWVFSWTFCGLYMIYELIFGNHIRENQLILFVFICFWSYYEYRIGYTWLWKRKGAELIKIDDGKLTYKRSLRIYGKAYTFYLENIKDLGPADKKPLSSMMANSFWVMGDESLQFDYNNRVVRFGIQLSDDESEKLRKVLAQSIQEEMKRNSQ